MSSSLLDCEHLGCRDWILISFIYCWLLAEWLAYLGALICVCRINEGMFPCVLMAQLAKLTERALWVWRKLATPWYQPAPLQRWKSTSSPWEGARSRVSEIQTSLELPPRPGHCSVCAQAHTNRPGSNPMLPRPWIHTSTQFPSFPLSAQHLDWIVILFY